MPKRPINELLIVCDNCPHARADHKKISNVPGLGVCFVRGCSCNRFELPQYRTTPALTHYGINWINS